MSERVQVTEGSLRLVTRTVISEVEAGRRVAAGVVSDARALVQELRGEHRRRQRETASRLREAAQAAAAADACRRDPNANCAALVAAANTAMAAHKSAQDLEREAAQAQQIGERALTQLEAAGRNFQRSIDGVEGIASRAARLLEPLTSYVSSSGAPSLNAAPVPLTPLPGGTQLVPLDLIDDADSNVRGPADFEHISSEDAAWMVEATEDRLLPALRAGQSREDLAQRDRDEGRPENRSYARLFDTMLNDRAIKLSARPDGRFEVIGGYHRIYMARQRGVSALPAKIR